MKCIIVILSLICVVSCSNPNLNVKMISIHNMMESEYVGLGNNRSSEYKRYEKLKMNASDEMIENLIDHKNPIVRTYAFKILIEREMIEPSEALKMALKHNETFQKMTADQILSSDICTEIYYHIKNKIAKSAYLGSQLDQLETAIIYEFDESHFLQYVVLSDNIYDQTVNSRINDLALKYNNPYAIFYLDRNKIITNTIKLQTSIKKALENEGIDNASSGKLRNLLKRLE